MTVTDQMDRKVEVPKNGPERIISLVPSQTELLYELGLGEKVVGITEFCVRPDAWHRSKPHVGGTKLILQKKVDALNPDLIIGNKEENTPRDIHRLEKKYPVWMSDINTVKEAKDMIEQVGSITGRQAESNEVLLQIEKNLKEYSDRKPAVKIAYFIWKNPWMVAGNNTFIHHFAEKMGFENVFSDKKRYPEINLDEINIRRPDFVLLSSEPFAFSEVNFQDFKGIVPESRIRMVDGQMFSWYGSRLIQGIKYLGDLRAELLKEINS